MIEPNTGLPAPNEVQIAHSARLIEHIVKHIEACGGVIPFYDYMHLCLYQPGLGYYAAGSIKFGSQGDFVTAPEVSPLFGGCLANHAAARFEQGLDTNILEFGAGSGRLCADLIERLESLGCNWNSYRILEPSADLRARQQELLQSRLSPAQLAGIEWLDGLPENFCGLVIGNEVLDAMPVNVVIKNGDWIELGVGFDGQRFVWREVARDGDAVEAMRIIDKDANLPDDYCTEINLNYGPWCQALSQSCGKAEVLLIDYGYERNLYYHPQRSSGTLMCFYQHRAHPDPLIYPGLQDITAFVDFDAFADAAGEAGFSVERLTTQAGFLMENGLLELAGSTEGNSLDTLALAQQVKTLTLPGEMGEKFKVIRLTIGGDQVVG